MDALNATGEKARPSPGRSLQAFRREAFAKALPSTVKSIAVLDRTKEPGAIGEPLYLDVRAALGEAHDTGLAHWGRYPRVVGGRYGLGSKDFTPAMAKAVFDNLSSELPRRTISR